QFVRFNQGRIRQASHVHQAQIQLQLMRKGRVVTGRLTLLQNRLEHLRWLDAVGLCQGIRHRRQMGQQIRHHY
ncbi:MAG: hypothetical protein AAF525_23130, partial [Pseudomonadota bacterium]